MHEQHNYTVSIPIGEMTSGAITIHQWDNALYHLPTGFEGGANDLTFLCSTNKTGTFVAAVDNNGVAVTSTPIANTWQAVQSDLFGLPYIKLRNASSQTAARTITISGSSPRG